MDSAAPPLLDSQVYYFRIGHGHWRGTFGFRITDQGYAEAGESYRRWQAEGVLQADAAPAVYVLEQSFAESGRTLRRFGLTLYLLRETYTLEPNGSDVAVHAHERFGPIPFLLRNEKRHSAAIHADGMSSTYFIPLLGADWIAGYTVHADRRHIDGVLTCAWAQATETIRKLND